MLRNYGNWRHRPSRVQRGSIEYNRRRSAKTGLSTGDELLLTFRGMDDAT